MPEIAVNLGDLTKPATVLIERVSDAVGGIAKPWQIKRVARAEAVAEVIRAEARIKITELEERGLRRLIAEEGKKQENIEKITMGAIPHLNEDAHPENLSEDWIAHFFERSRLASDEGMQALWSKILAGAANAPGSISRKTVDLVATLEKEDAEKLLSVYNRVVIFRDYKSPDDTSGEFIDIIPFVFDLEVYCGNAELSFNNLRHLDNLGFINFNSLAYYSFNNVPTIMEFKHNGRIISVRTKNSCLTIGCVVLTKAGSELFSVVGCECSNEVLDDIMAEWLDLGSSVFSNV